MATGYPWHRFAKLTIDHTKLTADVANFPVALIWNGTNGNIPAEVYNSGTYSPKSDGSDIRFTSDVMGNTELAFEIVTFTPNSTVGNARVEIYVKLTSISSASDTSFYMWWRNPQASAYAVGATYGRNAVWSNSFLAVYHMNEAAVVDATGNGYTLTNNGTTAGTTILGTARTFASGNDLHIASLFGSPSIITTSGLINCTGVASYAGEVFSMGDNINIRCRNNTTDGFRSSYRYATAWHDYLMAGFNPVGAGLFGGVFSVKTTATAAQFLAATGQTPVTGAYTDAIAYNQGTSTYWGVHGNGGGATFNFAGTIDEWRISNTNRNADWVTAEGNSTIGFQTFITAGTVYTPSIFVDLATNL